MYKRQINEGATASAAVLPYLAADTRYAGSGLALVHNVMSFAIFPFTSDTEFDEQANAVKEVRNKIENQMIDIYVERLGQKAENIKADLDSELLMNASEFVAKGYATEEGFPKERESTKTTNNAVSKFSILAATNRKSIGG